jgi:alkylation response protein AidB-like acyl-CoA dehydrogenase
MTADRAGAEFATALHGMLAGADVPGAARRWACGDPGSALALADGGPTAARDVSAAKVACADAAYRAARAALQVHGAIGYAAENDLSLWLLKVRALVPAWGGQAEHRARVRQELGGRAGRT